MKETISIIMGIYNCETTLKEAVHCIFEQTYSNWQLIMCDDASTDRTYTIALELQKLMPEKVIVLANKKNRGLNYTLNRCLKYAKGEYIARMDGDDVCEKNRFELELQVLREEPDISIVSSGMEYFDETGVWGRCVMKQYPVKEDFVHGSPFCHAPCLVRADAYRTVNGYTVSKKLLRVEDYELWIKMYAAGFKGKNIEEPLYKMRDDRNAFSRRKFKYRINEAYVKYLAVKRLHLPIYNLVYCTVPIIKGFMPMFIYKYLHKKRLAQQ